MATLLLRLCGPMQSWGTRSRFTERDTEMEPSKSGVVGLLCAALGRHRPAPVDDLAALTMGVRVDHEGTMARDYHTAGGGPGGGIVRASGALSRDAVLSNRYYLADADFLVGFESQDEGLLRELDAALRSPCWQLALGRKSFLPGLPVALPADPGQGTSDGIRPLPLRDALVQERWPLRPAAWRLPRAPQRLRLVLETSFTADRAELRMDQPLGAAFQDRTFGPRPIFQEFFEKEPTDVPQPAHA